MKFNKQYIGALILATPILLSACGGSSHGGKHHNNLTPSITVTSSKSSLNPGDTDTLTYTLVTPTANEQTTVTATDSNKTSLFDASNNTCSLTTSTPTCTITTINATDSMQGSHTITSSSSPDAIKINDVAINVQSDPAAHIEMSSDSSSSELLIPTAAHQLLSATIGTDTPQQIKITFTAKNISADQNISITTKPSANFINMSNAGTCSLDASGSCTLTFSAKAADKDGQQESIAYTATDQSGKTYPVTPANSNFTMTSKVGPKPGPGPKKSYSITIKDGSIAGVTTYPTVNSVCGDTTQKYNFTKWNDYHTFQVKVDAGQTNCTLNINQSGYSVTPASIDLNHPSATLQYMPNKVNASGTIYFHNTFPYTPAQKTIDTVKLNTPIINTTIMTNILAGVMYHHLIKEKYPTLQSNNYLYGTLFGQLLQEGGLEDGVINKTFNPSDPNQMMHNSQEVTILTEKGQGGPYQINDYAKRLPAATMDGALGLINYDPIAKALGYSISDQDSLAQNEKTGPAALDNIYIGPMLAAFYHFNDINRMQMNAAQDWHKFNEKWQKCYKAMQTAEGKELTNIVMNVVYNAGDYSEVLGAYLDICDNPTKNIDIIKNHINDYSADWQSYQQALNFSNPTAGDATYFRYPRQVNFYLDQLYNDNASLKAHHAGILSNNRVDFNLGTLESAFTMAMQQLSYNAGAADKRNLQLITEAQAQKAYADALTSNQLQTTSTLHLSDDANGKNDRATIYKLLDDAISNVEAATEHKMDETTAHGPPPPLPNPKNITLYDTKTCANDFTSGQYVKAQLTAGQKCEVFQCAQSGWCSNSCDTTYSLPINPEFTKAGWAYKSAWTDLNQEVNCSSST